MKGRSFRLLLINAMLRVQALPQQNYFIKKVRLYLRYLNIWNQFK